MAQKNSTGFVKAQSDNLPSVNVLTIADFFSENEFFNVAETRGVKAKRSEGKDYGDAAVGYVELKREGHLCHVRGRICPEHRVNNKPYSVSMLVDEETEKVQYVKCEDCAASEGGCKHAIAFLMWVHRRCEEPEPTATVCYWRKPVLAQVGSNVRQMKAKDLVEHKRAEILLPDNAGFLHGLVQKMKNRNFDSQLSRHLLPLESSKDLSIHALMLSFNNLVLYKNANSFEDFARREMAKRPYKDVAKDTIDQSNSALWKELRYGRITASKIYEVSRCKTPAGRLVEEIIGVVKLKDNVAMERGRRLEEQVLTVLEENLQTKLHRIGLLLNPDLPIIGASPDAVGEDFVVEVKCPQTLQSEERYINKENNICNKYMAQIQLQMLMQNVKRGYFCMAKHDFEVSGNIVVVCVDYDEQFINKIVADAMVFWKENIFPLLMNGIKK